MNLQLTGLITTTLGTLLILTAFVWGSVATNDRVWTEADANAHSEASKQYHADYYNDQLSEAEKELSAAAFEANNAKLSRAKSVQQTVPFYLRASGIAIVIVGITLLQIHRSKAKQDG